MIFEKVKTTIKKCPVCSNKAFLRLTKGNTEYFQCNECAILYSDPLDNDNKVGGGAEVERNENENGMRIARIDKILGGQKELIKILDFGCGHGMLVNDLIKSGYDAYGYDLYNEDFNSSLPSKETYQIVTAIEVIEHTSAPFVELDVIYRSMVKGGLLMIETSFIDVAAEEGVALEDFFYISPEVGHSTIFSHHALDVLMLKKGFIPSLHFNRHVRCYNKPFTL